MNRRIFGLCSIICCSEVSAVSVANALQATTPNSGITAQMGLKVSPDSVTIGDPFFLVVRVKVKPGFTVEFPQMPDSTEGSPSKIALVGTPLLQRAPGDSLEFRATYKFTAWDVGALAIPLTDVYVKGPGGAGFLPLRANVFVKSVLPQDTTLRFPKPPQERYPVREFNWLPFLIAAIALALGEMLWAIYRWYRNRKNAPRDPYEVAMQEFKRIETLQLPQKGEPEWHALLMAEEMRLYLAAKVPTANISDTPRQLIEHVLAAGLADERMREIMGQTELLKFAGAKTSPEAANRLGKNAREIVELVEKQMQPKPEAEAKAA